MTVIIWLKHEWQNYIAADCRISSWHEIISDKADKIVKHNNCFIWMSWWVAEEWIFKKILSDNQDLIINSEETITELYLKLRAVSKEYSLLDVWENPYINLVFVNESKMRKLYENWAVIEFWNHCCAWCWEDYAVWMLENTKITNPEQDLKDIIKKVSKYSSWVSPNSIVKMPLSTKVVKAIKKVSKPKA